MRNQENTASETGRTSLSLGYGAQDTATLETDIGLIAGSFHARTKLLGGSCSGSVRKEDL